MKFLATIGMLCLYQLIYSQNSLIDTSGVYTKVDQMPEYPGGDAELIKKLQDGVSGNCKQDEDFGGKIYLRFVIDTTGEIEEADIAQVAGLCEEIDANIMRVVKTLHFKPGMQDGHPVKVRYKIPIYIRSQ